MKAETSKSRLHLIVAFDIVNEQGKSILHKDYVNGSKKAMALEKMDLFSISLVRYEVEELVRRLTEFLSPNEHHPKHQDISAKELDEKAYIDALHDLIIPRVQCQIKEMENSQNGLPPKPKSMKELKEKFGSCCLSNYKSPHSTDH